MWRIFHHCPFPQLVFNSFPSLCGSFTPKNSLKTTLSSALSYGFFGALAKAKMKAMIHPSNSVSDKDDNDSESPPPPSSKSIITETTNKPKVKSTFKITMQMSLPITVTPPLTHISSPYLTKTTSKLPEDTSRPRPNYHLLTNPHTILFVACNYHY